MEFRGVDTVARLAKALSSKITLEIIEVLSKQELSPGEISQALGIGESIVSRKLKQLRELGLVEFRWLKEGERNVKRYRLKASGILLSFQEGVRAEPWKGQLEIEEIPEVKKVPSPIILGSGPPPRPKYFVGRETLLQQMSSFDGPLLLITGISGIGKTTLASEYIHRTGLSARTVWQHVTGMDNLWSLMRRISLSLKELGATKLYDYISAVGEARDPYIALKLLAQDLNEIKGVLVIDDYHNCNDPKIKEFLVELPRQLSKSKLIVLSRRAPQELLTANRERTLLLEVVGLSYSEVSELLRIHGLKLTDELIADVRVATQGIPALVTSFITLALTEGVEKAVNALMEGKIVKTFWRGIYGSLTPIERELLKALAHFDEPLTIDLISELIPHKNALMALYSLVDKNLVEELGTSFRVKDYIRPLVPTRPPNRTYYVRIARKYLATEDPDLLVLSLNYFAKAMDEQGCIDALHTRITKIRYRLLQILDSYTKVLEKVEKTAKNPVLIAYVNHELGVVLTNQGKVGDAIERLLRSVRISKASGNMFLHAMSNALLTILLSDSGRLDEAKKAFSEGLKSAHKIRNEYERNLALDTLYSNAAKLMAELGDLDKAYDYVIKEIEHTKRLGDPIGYSFALLHLAIVKALMGKVREVIPVLEEVLSNFKALKVKGLEIQCGYGLSAAYLEVGDYERAYKVGAEVVNQARELNIRRFHCFTLPIVIFSALKLGRTTEAKDLLKEYRSACAEARETECVGAVLEALTDVNEATYEAAVRACLNLGDYLTYACQNYDVLDRGIQELAKAKISKGLRKAMKELKKKCMSHEKRSRT